MRFILPTAAVLALIHWAIAASVHAAWLPDEIQEAIAQEIANRIAAADVEGTIPEEDRLKGARTGVSAIAAKVESLGVDAVVEMAPDYPDLQIPVAGQRHLDAIARFGICSLSMDSVYADDSERERALEQRVTAAIMSMSVVIASAYLREAYLATGVTDEDARNFLAGDELKTVSLEIEKSPELLQYTMDRCADPLSELLGPSVGEGNRG